MWYVLILVLVYSWYILINIVKYIDFITSCRNPEETFDLFFSAFAKFKPVPAFVWSCKIVCT